MAQNANIDFALRRLATSVKPQKVATYVPTQQSSVSRSVYGGALRTVCAERKPRTVIEPCAELKAVVTGGVKDDELDELDDAVERLNEALGLIGSN